MALSNSTISNNQGEVGGGYGGGSALLGGGFYILGGSVTLSNCVIFNNTAVHGGGGFYVSGGSVTLSNSVVSSNKAGDGRGAGMYISGAATVKLIASKFYFNIASTDVVYFSSTDSTFVRIGKGE